MTGRPSRSTATGFTEADDAVVRTRRPTLVRDAGGSGRRDDLVKTDGALRAFVDVDGAPTATVRDLATDDPRVVDVNVLAAADGRVQFTLRDPSLVEYLAEQGVVLDSVTATAGTGRAVLELPPNGGVRSVLGRVREEYSEVELIARREHQRERRSERRFRGLLEERLTDRQHEALQVAYRSGFFERPREQTGERWRPSSASPSRRSSSTCGRPSGSCSPRSSTSDGRSTPANRDASLKPQPRE